MAEHKTGPTVQPENLLKADWALDLDSKIDAEIKVWR